MHTLQSVPPKQIIKQKQMLQVRSACTDLTNHWKRTNSAFHDHVRHFMNIFSPLLLSIIYYLLAPSDIYYLMQSVQVEQVR